LFIIHFFLTFVYLPFVYHPLEADHREGVTFQMSSSKYNRALRSYCLCYFSALLVSCDYGGLVRLHCLAVCCYCGGCLSAAQVSADDMMKQGLLRASITAKMQAPVSKKRNNRRFKAHYGSSPEVCVALWDALQTTTIRNARIRPFSMNLDWFFDGYTRFDNLKDRRLT
jgi:hypothetical protein